jgi:hypothetical protein
VIDLQGNFVASSLLIISNGFFFQRWVLDLCCGIFFYFSFIVQGANVMCGRWVCFVIYHVDFLCYKNTFLSINLLGMSNILVNFDCMIKDHFF